MTKIKSLSSIRDELNEVAPGTHRGYKMTKIITLSDIRDKNESLSCLKPQLCRPVNPYRIIQTQNRIIDLQSQAIGLLTHEIKELKRQ